MMANHLLFIEIICLSVVLCVTSESTEPVLAVDEISIFDITLDVENVTTDYDMWNDLYLIHDLPRVKIDKRLDYDTIVGQLKHLKERLYNNFTKISEDEIPPPRGSHILHDEARDTVAIITRVGLHLSPDRIVRMDVEQQSLTLQLNEDVVWRDESLQWARDSDLLIENVLLNNSEIWTPPIVASGIVAEEEVISSGLVLVFSDGLCLMSRSVQYTMPCTVNVEDFPFDMHTCFLTYDQIATTHNRMYFAKIDVENNNTRADKIYLNEQYAHLEWVGVSASQELLGEENDRLQFTISLQRQSSFYAIVLIFPTVLLNILSLVVFTLPIDTTERENFSLTLTLTYFVLVMIIVDTSPPTGNQIPKLGLYVIMCTVLVVVTFGMSLILIELHEHKRAKKRRMSSRLFAFLQRCCCFEKCFSDYHQSSRGSYAFTSDADGFDEDNLLKIKTNNNKYSVDAKREEFKWKLLARVLNLIFFVCTLLGHLVLPCLIYLG